MSGGPRTSIDEHPQKSLAHTVESERESTRNPSIFPSIKQRNMTSFGLKEDSENVSYSEMNFFNKKMSKGTD